MDGGRPHIWARRALQLVAIGAAFGVAPAVASADDLPPAQRFAVGSPAMSVAQQIATDQWGAPPCGGQVDVQWGTDEANINARSYWANPSSAYGAPQLNVQCRVVFNSQMRYDWPKFCTVLVHEFGHLAGHEHTADGPDVMSPIYRGPLPACEGTPDPSAAPPSALVSEPAATVAATPVAAEVPSTTSATARKAVKRPRAKHSRRGRSRSAR